MNHKMLLLVALVLCAVQAQAVDRADHSAWYRTTSPRVAPSPGDALPSDSLNCRLIGQYPNPESAHYGMNNLAVVGNLVYLPAGGRGLDILSASDPANPVVVGNLPTGGSIDAVAVEGSYAYACGSGYLRAVDISDSSNPHTVDDCGLNGYSLGVTKFGDYAYVCNWTSGLQVVDVSNPANVHVVGQCSSYGARTVALVGDYACVANAAADSLDMVRVIDAGDPVHPTEVGHLDMYCVEGIHTVGSTNHVFAADGSWLRMVDVSIPASPVEIGNYNNPGYCYAVDVVGNYAYVADGQMGLLVLDISDPTDPQKVGHYRVSGGDAQSVVKVGDYIYVTDYYNGLLIIEFYAVGVEEGRRPPAYSSQLTATIVRGNLFLTEDRGRKTEDRVALVDAAGRRVMELQPGPNDVQHLIPGVYFISSPGSVEKVLLTR